MARRATSNCSNRAPRASSAWWRTRSSLRTGIDPNPNGRLRQRHRGRLAVTVTSDRAGDTEPGHRPPVSRQIVAPPAGRVSRASSGVPHTGPLQSSAGGRRAGGVRCCCAGHRACSLASATVTSTRVPRKRVAGRESTVGCDAQRMSLCSAERCRPRVGQPPLTAARPAAVPGVQAGNRQADPERCRSRRMGGGDRSRGTSRRRNTMWRVVS